jgi:hypothetical protein
MKSWVEIVRTGIELNPDLLNARVNMRRGGQLTAQPIGLTMQSR